MGNASEPRISLILPAAGKGTRTGLPSNKVFVEYKGRPLVAHTLSCFAGLKSIQETILVVAAEDLEQIRQKWGCLLGELGVMKLIPGGTQRQNSVLAGIRASSPESSHLIVHDAARPLILESDIIRVIESALDAGACILGHKLTDTIKVVSSSGVVEETLDRSQLWAAETPQMARRDWLLDALTRAVQEGWDVTDEAAALERCGKSVKMIGGRGKNPKITWPQDLRLFHNIQIKYDKP